MKTLLIIFGLWFIASSISKIVEVQDNVPNNLKFGVKQERAQKTCKERGHTESFAPKIRSNGDYDFIVVGGGSAGNVIAARLADSNPDVKILLLESGKNFVDNSEEMSQSMEGIFKTPYCAPDQTADSCSLLSLPLHFAETPFMVPYASSSNHSYYYQTTPQLYANKREINYPRGNMLGGSSATNNLVAFRGHPEDYDHWASLGLNGWSYNDLLPFMKRVETNHQYASNTEVHGSNGPIHLYNASDFWNFPVSENLLEAAWKLGYPKVEDFNKGHDYYGAGHWQQYTNDKGRRTSSYEYIRRMIKGSRVCIDGLIAEAVTGDKEDLKVPSNPNEKNKNKRIPCDTRQNLHILTSAFATKIIFDKDNNGGKSRAIGVEYVDHKVHSYKAVRPYRGSFSSEEEKTRQGLEYWKTNQRHDVMNCPVNEELAFDNSRSSEWYIPPYDKPIPESETKRVYAKREIILSAGAVNSPQLLMLSGVGPRKHLEHDLNMKDDEIIMNLPGVGRLLDHEEIAVNFKTPTQHWGPLKDLFPETTKWANGEKGALSANHVPAGLDTSSDGVNGTVPTIHIHFVMFYFENIDFNQWRKQDAAHRVPAGLTDFAFFRGLEHYTMLIERSGTCSEGKLRLKNRNPLLPPLIDMNYGSCQFSNQELLFGIKEVRKLNEMLPEQYRGEEVIPGKEYDTDDKLLNWIRNAVWGHHISGSLPMGACDDSEAVLDNHGRVFGIEGLRVADASAFPTIPHGNILYSTYAVAERISEFLIEDNQLKSNLKSNYEGILQKPSSSRSSSSKSSSEKKKEL